MIQLTQGGAYLVNGTDIVADTPDALKISSINCNFTVEPQTFTTDLTIHLRSL